MPEVHMTKPRAGRCHIGDIECVECRKTAIVQWEETYVTITCDHCDANFDYKRHIG